MNGSPTKRRKANSSHTQTIACIHQNATERNRSEIELPRHVKVRGTDDQNGRPRLPHEATFDCAERLQSIFTEIAAANRRQRYRRRHRHAADPDHHRQHMQCASQNDVIHNCTGKTVRPNSDIRVLTAFSCRRVCAGTNPPPIRTAALLFPHGCTRHAFFPSAAVDGIVCRSFPAAWSKFRRRRAYVVWAKRRGYPIKVILLTGHIRSSKVAFASPKLEAVAAR